jgi:hypothetical protein
MLQAAGMVSAVNMTVRSFLVTPGMRAARSAERG